MKRPSWLCRLVPYLGRRQAEEGLQEELQLHLALERERQRKRGLPEDDALRAAKRTLGNPVVIREHTRDMWGWRWLGDLARDLRHAGRSLRRSPGLATTVTLILALGIGANTAVFSIVYGVLLRPLPYPDPAAIVRIGDSLAVPGVSDMYLSDRSMPLLQENAVSFEQLAAYQEGSAEWNGATLSGTWVSPSLFALFRVSPHLGRLFLEEDARSGAERVVLLSYGAWTNRFASNPAVVGSTVDFNGNPHLVVGVLADGFHFPTPNTDFWMPYVIAPTTTTAAPGQPGGPSFTSSVLFKVLGRLRPGVSAQQAAAEAGSILQGNSDGVSASAAAGGGEVRVVPLLDQMVREYRPALSILTVVTVLVLLIACLNAAGLLLARGVVRSRMLAISAAMGASRGRLVRQLLSESLVLSLGAGLLGLAVAVLLLRAVPALAPADVARLDEVRIDGVVFTFTTGLSILVGLLCGTGPAFQLSQLHLVRILTDGSAQSAAGSGLRRTHRMRMTLSAVQVALAVVLLICAGLLLRSFVQLFTFDRGFDPTNVIAARVTKSLRGGTARDLQGSFQLMMAEQQRSDEHLSGEIATRLELLPDVEAVGLARSLPFGRSFPSEAPLRVAGSPVPSDPNEMVQTKLQVVGPGYLDAMRFRLQAGRTFTVLDGRESPRVLVANEALARRLFGSWPAVGQRVIVLEGEPWEVVGVVGNIVYGGLDVTGHVPAEAYFPLAQASERFFGFSSATGVVVRTAGDPRTVIPFLREAIAAADPRATMSEVTTMEARLLNAVAWPRLYAFFVGSLAALALVLAAVGVYGLLSYTVAKREREIGIRMALGAGNTQIVALVVGQGAALVGAGALLGMVAAAAGSQMLESLLYGVSGGDPLTFLLAPVVLVAVALVACWFPARRATSVDPMRVLHSE